MGVPATRTSVAKVDRLVSRAYWAYHKGEAISAIADRQNVTPQWLYTEFHKRGWRLRPSGSRGLKVTPELRRKIVSLSERRFRVVDIAQKVGVSRWTVTKVRRAEGVEVTRVGGSTAPGRRSHKWDGDGCLTHKWCSMCRQMRQAKFFWSNARTGDGKQTQCMSCARAHRRRRAAAARQAKTEQPRGTQ